MEILSFVSAFIYLIPVCIGLLQWKKLSTAMRMAWLSPLFGLCMSIISQITAEANINNHFLFYLIAIIGPFLYLLFYLRIIREPSVRLWMIIATMAIIVFVFICIIVNGFQEYFNSAFIITDVLIICLALWTMQQYDLPKPIRVINWGIFIYLLQDLTYSILSAPLYNYLRNEFLTLLFYGINPFFVILAAMMYSYSFWIARGTKPPDFSELQEFNPKPA